MKDKYINSISCKTCKHSSVCKYKDRMKLLADYLDGHTNDYIGSDFFSSLVSVDISCKGCDSVIPDVHNLSKESEIECAELLKDIHCYLENKLGVDISCLEFKYFASNFSIIGWMNTENGKEYSLVLPAVDYLLSIQPSTRKFLYDRSFGWQFNK